jgi:hypothetical protein
MRTNPLPENGQMPPEKPLTVQQELVTEIGSGGVCKECLNEDHDSCVCPVPED